VTRKQFEQRAVREAERGIGVPADWWGTWKDVRGPNGERVRFSGRCWTVSLDGQRISQHDSRAYAMRRAKILSVR